MQNGLLYARYTRKEDIVRGKAKNAVVEVPEPVAVKAKKAVAKVPEPVVVAAPSSTRRPKPVAVPAAQPVSTPTGHNGALAKEQEPAADAQTGEGPAVEKKRKPRWTEEQKEAAKAARALEPKDKKKKKSKKKKKKTAESDDEAENEAPSPKKLKHVPLEPEERVSGPGNAAEAVRMRSAFGLEAEQAPVPSAPSLNADGGFSFGFQPSPLPQESPKAEQMYNIILETEPVAVESPPEQRPSSSSPSSSSSEEESSSSSSDEEEAASPSPKIASRDKEAPAPPATPALPASDATPTPPRMGVGNAEAGEDYVPRRVYIGGMPYRYTEEQVRDYWSYCGVIESLDMMTFPDTGRFKGIVFITFASEEAYKSALDCDGCDCDGQILKVKQCKAPVKKQVAEAALIPLQPLPDGASPTPGTWQQSSTYQKQEGDWGASNQSAGWDAVSFVSRTYQAPEQNQEQPREEAPKTPGYWAAYVGNIAYGADEAAIRRLFEPFNVTRVRLHTDKDTGRPKGYAHVHFKDDTSLDRAMALNGAHLMGRPIKVGYAQAKKTESTPGESESGYQSRRHNNHRSSAPITTI